MQLTGWAGPSVAAKAREGLEHEVVPFCFNATEKTANYLWKYEQLLHGGKTLPALTQETGDCVSFASAKALDDLAAASICAYGMPYKYQRAFPPFIYGMSRCAPDCGNGQLGRSGGSVGVWAVQAMKKYGVLYADDPGVPDYSGRLADQWGYRGVPDEFQKEAVDNPLESYSPITSVEQLRNALLNDCPVIIGSSWGFKTEEYRGHIIYRRSGEWMHEMLFRGWQDDPFPAAFRQNSWGDDSTPAPLNGEPHGGAWCPAEDLEKEIQQAELWSLNRVRGNAGGGRYSSI